MIKRRQRIGDSGQGSGTGHPQSSSPNGLDIPGAAKEKRASNYRSTIGNAILLTGLLLLACLMGIFFARYSEYHSDVTVRSTVNVEHGPVVNADIPADKFSSDDLLHQINSIRNEFETRYGGSDAAHGMLQRGIKSFSNRHTQHTADRILRAAASTDPRFVASFGGYSVTVARGNLFSQSYPFVFERILKNLLKEIGVDLVVRNSAIGGIPSFPYGWCLPNFLGKDSDLVSWDYGMNEGNDSKGLEAYIRHALATMPKQPLIVILDDKRSRMQLMEKYVEMGALVDPVAIIRSGNVVDKTFLEMNEEDRPDGFKKWDEWGAPKGSPGQSSWHPKFKEHELMGWNLAMYFLDAIEEASKIMSSDTNWKKKYSEFSVSPKPLPPPQTSVVESEAHILQGTKQSDGLWHMNPTSCRTSFLPSQSGPTSEIVLSGVVEDFGGPMESKDDAIYKEGWVADVGRVERDTKRKVEQKGGLGYIDMKLALYGIPESGVLSLWLPYEGVNAESSCQDGPADKCFDTIMICEVNEKRGNKECKMESDVTYKVGGVVAKGVSKLKTVASYLKKEICVLVPVPVGAKIVSQKDIPQADSEKYGDHANHGVVLDIEVTNASVSREEGACSISHIVWQTKANK